MPGVAVAQGAFQSQSSRFDFTFRNFNLDCSCLPD